jgi:hypothetical protein
MYDDYSGLVQQSALRSRCAVKLPLSFLASQTTGIRACAQQQVRVEGHFRVFSATTKYRGFTLGADDLLRRQPVVAIFALLSIVVPKTFPDCDCTHGVNRELFPNFNVEGAIRSIDSVAVNLHPVVGTRKHRILPAINVYALCITVLGGMQHVPDSNL